MVSKPKNAEGIVTTEGTTIYEHWSKSATNHKALDFSNIGMPITTESNAATGEEKHLRQFHQMRIFVENFGNMFHHGDAQKISSTYIISSNLPQTISYTLNSVWQPPLGSIGGSTFNMLMQFGSQLAKDKGWIENGASGVHRANTLLVWGGSKPLELQLKIPVIDDNYGTSSSGGISANLVEALEFLGSLCLPTRANGAGFYEPPPSPLQGEIKWGDAWSVNLKTNYARIMIQLGGILLLDNCIIKGISVNYPNTKTQIKHTYPQSIVPGMTGSSYLTPMLAEVTINVTTVEAVTADNYSKMLWLQKQDEMGNFTADLQVVKTKGAEIGGAAWNAITGANQEPEKE